jgi:SAM-dependent methyltransferase
MSEPKPTFDAPFTRCPLCEFARVSEFDHDFRGIRISRCERCGVRFMNPQYEATYLAAYYADYTSGFEAVQSPEHLATRRRGKDSHLAVVERFARPGRLLSIGSGDGTELRVARARGWDVVGYDVDEPTTRRLAAQIGAVIHSGDLFSVGLGNGTFDCVFMDQVLEHPKDPGRYLQLSHRVLRPGGVLFLGVPNTASISAVAKTWLGRMGIKRSRGKHYDTWHHLFYYTPKSLRTILESYYGFQVVLLEGDPKPPKRESHLAKVETILLRRFPFLDSSMRIVALRRR